MRLPGCYQLTQLLGNKADAYFNRFQATGQETITHFRRPYIDRVIVNETSEEIQAKTVRILYD